MLLVLVGKKVFGLMIVMGLGIYDLCVGVMEVNKFWNVLVYYLVNGWCFCRIGNFNLMKKLFDLFFLIF